MVGTMIVFLISPMRLHFAATGKLLLTWNLVASLCVNTAQSFYDCFAEHRLGVLYLKPNSHTWLVGWSWCCRLLFVILLTNTQSCSILCISLMERKLIVSKGEVQCHVTIVGCEHVLICAWKTFCVVFLPNEHGSLCKLSQSVGVFFW